MEIALRGMASDFPSTLRTGRVPYARSLDTYRSPCLFRARGRKKDTDPYCGFGPRWTPDIIQEVWGPTLLRLPSRACKREMGMHAVEEIRSVIG